MPAAKRPIRTRFPSASTRHTEFRLATNNNSLDHYAKGTPLRNRSHAMTACKLMVSDSISLPSPGFFSTFPHGTSTLSIWCEYLALSCGQDKFPQSFTCSVVLGNTNQKDFASFTYRTITLYGSAFQRIRLEGSFVTFRGICCSLHRYPTTPKKQHQQA